MKISWTALTRILIENNYSFVVKKDPHVKDKNIWVILIPKNQSKIETKIVMSTGDGSDAGEVIRNNWNNYTEYPVVYYDTNENSIIAITGSFRDLISDAKNIAIMSSNKKNLAKIKAECLQIRNQTKRDIETESDIVVIGNDIISAEEYQLMESQLG